MLNLRPTKQFEKDYKKCIRRGYDMEKLQAVLRTLLIPESLEPKYKDHFLTGNYKDHRECHIEPDWLLIYRSDDVDLIPVRTGTHSDLFK